MKIQTKIWLAVDGETLFQWSNTFNNAEKEAFLHGANAICVISILKAMKRHRIKITHKIQASVRRTIKEIITGIMNKRLSGRISFDINHFRRMR